MTFTALVCRSCGALRRTTERYPTIAECAACGEDVVDELGSWLALEDMPDDDLDARLLDAWPITLRFVVPDDMTTAVHHYQRSALVHALVNATMYPLEEYRGETVTVRDVLAEHAVIYVDARLVGIEHVPEDDDHVDEWLDDMPDGLVLRTRHDSDGDSYELRA